MDNLGVDNTEGVEELLFTSAVSLCVALASTPIGAAALLEAQVSDILFHCYLWIHPNCLSSHPPLHPTTYV